MSSQSTQNALMWQLLTIAFSLSVGFLLCLFLFFVCAQSKLTTPVQMGKLNETLITKKLECSVKHALKNAKMQWFANTFPVIFNWIQYKRNYLMFKLNFQVSNAFCFLPTFYTVFQLFWNLDYKMKYGMMCTGGFIHNIYSRYLFFVLSSEWIDRM